MIWADILTIIKELIKNSVLLFGLGFLYSISNYGLEKPPVAKKVAFGITLGIIAIFLMMFPFKYSDGIFFDTRSVLYSISGFLFGLVPTVIAAIIGMGYRMYIGGAGVVPGTLTIILPAALGIFWKKKWRVFPKAHESLEIYIFGLITTMLALLIFVVFLEDKSIILKLFIPYFIALPAANIVLLKIFNIFRERASIKQQIISQEIFLKTIVDALEKHGVFTINKDYNYTFFNKWHKELVKKYTNTEIKLGDSVLALISEKEINEIIKTNIDKAFLGETAHTVFKLSGPGGPYFEDSYSPIYNSNQEVIAVAVISKDITETKQYEQKILSLSYLDTLTKIPNRRYYDEKYLDYDKEENFPLSIITIDVDALKIFNDTFGHHIGDSLLCKVASFLQKKFEGQEDSVVARVGGDEFVILLPKTSYEQAEKIIHDLKEGIYGMRIKNIGISTSFGLATKIEQGITKTSLEQMSDEEMYTEKFANSILNRKRVLEELMSNLFKLHPYEKEHITIMRDVVLKMSDILGFDAEKKRELRQICYLHDIGKIVIGEEILNKNEPLDDCEIKKIKTHPTIGYKILMASFEYSHLAKDVFCHHERYDGKGYPRKLRKDQIPLNARIIAIAETYSALTCKNSYRKVLTKEEALEVIKKQSGKQFDPELVDVFLRAYPFK